jgi:hypothetical protein
MTIVDERFQQDPEGRGECLDDVVGEGADRAPSSVGGRGGPRDRGQALPLVALVVAVALGVSLAVARIGSMLVAHARARAAADAAALAGVTGGREAAAELARRNGAVLVEFIREGTEVEVRVRVGPAVALARAEWSVGPAPQPA